MCGIIESRSVGAQAALGTYTQANYHNYVNNYVATQVNYHNQLFPVPEQPSCEIAISCFRTTCPPPSVPN